MHYSCEVFESLSALLVLVRCAMIPGFSFVGSGLYQPYFPPVPLFVCRNVFQFVCGLHKVCSHILARSDLLCGLHKVRSHIMARSDLLCGLHKVCSHIMARSDLFRYLSKRIERLSRGLVSHTCTHCGPIFSFLLWIRRNEMIHFVMFSFPGS